MTMDNNNNLLRPASAASGPKSIESVGSASGSSRPVSASSIGSFSVLFRTFAKFGDSKSQGDAITLSNSDKWMRQAKVIDSKLTTVDTGICFKQVAKNKKALTENEYDLFLNNLAKSKKVESQSLKDRLAASGLPATHPKTTSAQINAAVARLTDHTKYTGSHKHRFDETGKGLGKAGRVDICSNPGYVNGLKGETANQKAH